MMMIRNILSGMSFMTTCRCCGELFGADCDTYCKWDGCPDGCQILSSL